MMNRDDAREIGYASLYFNELFKKVILASMPPTVTTKTQMDLLMTLMINGPMSMSALSQRAGIAPEQTTRTIRALREAGLVRSDRSEGNRRVVMAQITEEGKRLMDDHERQLAANMAACLDGLSDEEISQLARLAQQATTILSKTGFKHAVPA